LFDWVDGMSQAEIRLEWSTPDVEAAGGVRREEFESLPEGFNALWIQTQPSILRDPLKKDKRNRKSDVTFSLTLEGEGGKMNEFACIR
jgi:hypothetical protein